VPRCCLSLTSVLETAWMMRLLDQSAADALEIQRQLSLLGDVCSPLLC
jgi:hypothetical protein